MRIPQGKIAKEFKGEEQQDALKENIYEIYCDISLATNIYIYIIRNYYL